MVIYWFFIFNMNLGFLEGKFMVMEKFGKFCIDVLFDIFIEFLNLDKYFEMNKMFVKILYDMQFEEIVDLLVFVVFRECYDFDMNI